MENLYYTSKEEKNNILSKLNNYDPNYILSYNDVTNLFKNIHNQDIFVLRLGTNNLILSRSEDVRIQAYSKMIHELKNSKEYNYYYNIFHDFGFLKNGKMFISDLTNGLNVCDLTVKKFVEFLNNFEFNKVFSE